MSVTPPPPGGGFDSGGDNLSVPTVTVFNPPLLGAIGNDSNSSDISDVQ